MILVCLHSRINPSFLKTTLPLITSNKESGLWTVHCKSRVSPSWTEKSYRGVIWSSNRGITTIKICRCFHFKTQTSKTKYQKLDKIQLKIFCNFNPRGLVSDNIVFEKSMPCVLTRDKLSQKSKDLSRTR